MPEKLRSDVALYVGCVAGCAERAEYERWLEEAGCEGEFFASFIHSFVRLIELLLIGLLVDALVGFLGVVFFG